MDERARGVPHIWTERGVPEWYGLVCDDMGMSAAPAPGGPDTVVDLGHEVYQIDTFMAGYDRITAAYLIRADRPCLVETGTAPSAPVVRDALASLGVGPADLATVVVTHIHLDHAGGIGDIAQMFPRAEVVAHERGAPHLADPEVLMASAWMVWRDRLEALYGTMAPTPAERIRAVEQTGAIDLGGGRRLESHYAPGHASHHLGLVDSLSGDLYVGDAAGVYIPDTGDLRPATPPPDFDLQAALNSLRTFAALRPSRLLFSHFGPVQDVQPTLDRAAEELNVWVEETRRARASGPDLDYAVTMVAERVRDRYAIMRDDADPGLAAKYDQTSGTRTNVAGIFGWLSKQPAGSA
jgi:glyoxylase-like metal-dependent hydrolase (beta-lactamase superfamily II)